MKCITDLIPGDKGACAIVTLSNPDDTIVNRAIYNLDYLEKVIKELKKDIGRSKKRRLVEIQFVTSKYAKINSIDKCAITFRGRVSEKYQDAEKEKPDAGYYAIGPIVNTWSSMAMDDLIVSPNKPMNPIIGAD